MRAKSDAAPAANDARDQRLREAREVLDQDVPVGEQAEQDELERLALADDRALDLGEDLLRPLRQLGDCHLIHSSRSIARRRSRGRTPGPKRLSGTGRSGRNELPELLAQGRLDLRAAGIKVQAAAVGKPLGGDPAE